MVTIDELRAALERVARREEIPSDLQLLRQALLKGEITAATGEQAVAVGGDANDLVITTSDAVVSLFKSVDARTLREALNVLAFSSRAEEDFTLAIARGQDDAEAYFRRGWARFLQGNHSGAEEDFTLAIARGQDDAEAYFRRGWARFLQGNHSGAEEDFTLAIARGQDDADVHSLRGLARYNQGNHSGAEEDFTLAIARGQDDAEAYQLTENLEQAIAAYKAALEVYTQEAHPNEWARTQSNLGIAYQNRILGEPAENLEQAIAAYKAALEVYTQEAHPNEWARTQSNLGIAYQNRILGEPAENLEQAIAAYKAALTVRTRTDRTRTEALQAVASALAQASRFQEAQEAAQAIENPYRRAEVLQAVASALARAGREEEAKRTFQEAQEVAQAIEDVGSRAEMLRATASALAQAGRFKEADELWAALERVARQETSAGDLELLQQALARGETITAAGERAVAIGGDARDSVIITGDSNTSLFPFKVSLLHPRKLSKKLSSPFIVLIYPLEKSEEAHEQIEAEERHWLGQSGQLEEHLDDAGLPTDPAAVDIRLSSPAIDFSDGKTRVLLRDQLNSLSFTGQPKDTCQPGTHAALLSITSTETGHEYKSLVFPVTVVHFAFDHVSSPLLSNLTSAVLAMASAAAFALTFLGQVDQTLGLASGGAAGAVAGFIHMRFLSLFKLLRPSIVDQ